MDNAKDSLSKGPDWGKVREDYENEVAKAQVLSTNFYIALLWFSITGIFIIYNTIFLGKEICFGILTYVSIKSFSVIEGRGGHKEGYIDGYNVGYTRSKEDMPGAGDEARIL